MTFMSKKNNNNCKISISPIETNMKQAWPNQSASKTFDSSSSCNSSINNNNNNNNNNNSTTINKLKCPTPLTRLRVEKIEGGLMVAGVVVAANCQIILPVFGFLFLLVGCVLTAASYRGPGEDEPPENYAARIAFTGNSRILGPACIVFGILMLLAGCILCLLTRRARQQQCQQTIGFHCPLHGDFYPLSPITSSRTIAVIENGGGVTGTCSLCWPRKKPSGHAAVAVGPPQCPHSQLSSTRSSLASSNNNSTHSHCPTPLPFLVNSGSIGGIVPQTAQLSPDQPFGSIRSLAVSREVASFPLSRTPTPPPSSALESLANPNLVQIPDEEKLVGTTYDDDDDDDDDDDRNDNSTIVPMPMIRNGPRKSVSIVLPTEGNG